MYATCQGDPIYINVVEGLQYVAKEALLSGYGKRHEADLSKHLVPLGETEALLCGWYACQYF